MIACPTWNFTQFVLVPLRGQVGRGRQGHFVPLACSGLFGLAARAALAPALGRLVGPPRGAILRGLFHLDLVDHAPVLSLARGRRG
jgi:hypothetical protein